MNQFGLPFRTLLSKEIKRYLSIWIQTLLTPVITTGLYLIIFGVSLGSQIRPTGSDVSYLQFIVPGLVMMGIINNSAMSGWGSIFIGKIQGYLNDILTAPLSYLEMAVGYVTAGALRGFLVGLITWLVSLVFDGPIPVHPFYALAFAIGAAMFFACAGLIVAVWAKDFDQMGAFSTFILLPLVYLGGVFYSLQTLPEIWQKVSRFNPIFYMVDGLRYGFLGISDADPRVSLLFVFGLAALGVSIIVAIFKSGWKLRA